MTGMLACQKLLACLEIGNDRVCLDHRREHSVGAAGEWQGGDRTLLILKGSLGAQGAQINMMKLPL